MELIETSIPDVKVFTPARFKDHRGFFSEVYSDRAFRQIVGREVVFVQDNHSLSVEKGVLRGLHYQMEPMSQEKLLRVIRGAILDIALDIRRGSPTFGQHVSAILTADNWQQIFVPAGFAHGFVTLESNTEVLYKVSNLYSPKHERGIRWNDPALGIDWKIDPVNAILSARDLEHPVLAQATDLF